MWPGPRVTGPPSGRVPHVGLAAGQFVKINGTKFDGRLGRVVDRGNWEGRWLVDIDGEKKQLPAENLVGFQPSLARDRASTARPAAGPCAAAVEQPEA